MSRVVAGESQRAFLQQTLFVIGVDVANGNGCYSSEWPSGAKKYLAPRSVPLLIGLDPG